MRTVIKKALIKIKTCLPRGVQRELRRRYYLRVVKNYRAADWEWMPVVTPLIPRGGHVLDIGANVGYLSRIFADIVGIGGRVVSVEPIPDTFDVLRHSMKTLHPDIVTTLPLCISDRAGEVYMAVPKYAGGGENYYESRIVTDDKGHDGQLYRVKASTLSAEVARLGLMPDFIKIDVEGHELAVIRGGANFFARKQPPLLIEVASNPDEAGTSASELFDLLGSHGYLAHVLDKGVLRLRQSGDQSVDYLFLKKN
ncbi:MAG TPA: FkbM family methyltransferase [Kiritimatiellia bacterium]|nr:FkbM family methyltransferase [Kiritimatiellia bacterium]